MKLVTHRLRIPKRRRSAEVASFLEQLDDLNRRLVEDLRGIGAAELAWQPKRGMNTIGMLLAHMAIVEVFWTLVAFERSTPEALEQALGLGIDDDGMPLPPDGAPPRGLRGRSLRWYAGHLARARAFSRRSFAGLGPRGLEREVERTRRRDGQRSRVNLRWILYHVLEHQAGHHGQILLLRHQYRDRRRP
jgi:uncharacterized damage-inducible protein DinB